VQKYNIFPNWSHFSFKKIKFFIFDFKSGAKSVFLTAQTKGRQWTVN